MSVQDKECLRDSSVCPRQRMSDGQYCLSKTNNVCEEQLCLSKTKNVFKGQWCLSKTKNVCEGQ